jgi:hypothetical protein
MGVDSRHGEKPTTRYPTRLSSVFAAYLYAVTNPVRQISSNTTCARIEEQSHPQGQHVLRNLVYL